MVRTEAAGRAAIEAMERGGSTNRTETLAYIHGMLGQLRDLAASERMDMLTYLIEMAFVEATDIMRGDRPPRGTGSNVQ